MRAARTVSDTGRRLAARFVMPASWAQIWNESSPLPHVSKTAPLAPVGQARRLAPTELVAMLQRMSWDRYSQEIFLANANKTDLALLFPVVLAAFVLRLKKQYRGPGRTL